VLSTPPAFVLSQDQTLRKEFVCGDPKITTHLATPRLLAMPMCSDYWNESDSFNNPKESQRQIALPWRFFGIDLVHTVEFSRIGHPRLAPFRVCVEASLPSFVVFRFVIASREKLPCSTAWLRRSGRHPTLVHYSHPGNQWLWPNTPFPPSFGLSPDSLAVKTT
jgi:hypothetical protein